jgi:hypothetical protein
MKWSFTTFALAMALSAGSMPASADVYDNWLSDIGRRESLSRSGERAERSSNYGEERSARSERRRVARAAISDDDDFDYRPRRTVREGSRAHHAGGGRKSRLERHSRQFASERPAAQARSPKWAQRSVSTGGSTGSGLSGMASYYWQGQRVA